MTLISIHFKPLKHISTQFTIVQEYLKSKLWFPNHLSNLATENFQIIIQINDVLNKKTEKQILIFIYIS